MLIHGGAWIDVPRQGGIERSVRIGDESGMGHIGRMGDHGVVDLSGGTATACTVLGILLIVVHVPELLMFLLLLQLLPG